jgi:putative sigma-54 modulation protein
MISRVEKTGTNLELDTDLKKYIDKKIGKLDRYLPDIEEARVEITQEKTKSSQDRNIVQVTLKANGTILRAEERCDSIYPCIDAVANKIHRQIARYKGKREDRWHGHNKRSGEMIEAMPALEQEVLESIAEEDEREIVRVKRFHVDPMNEDEAVEQMELLGHNFFVFYNADLGRINVLYRRSDNNYGLIDPEIA